VKSSLIHYFIILRKLVGDIVIIAEAYLGGKVDSRTGDLGPGGFIKLVLPVVPNAEFE